VERRLSSLRVTATFQSPVPAGANQILKNSVKMHPVPAVKTDSGIAKRCRAPILVESMPTVAEQLRHAREAMKLSLHQIAEATKLKTDQVLALEEGNYEYFTAAVYLRGSVRTYSNLLKLDTAKLLEQLDTELSGSEKFAEQSLSPRPPKGAVDSVMLHLSRVNWLIAAGILGLAVVVLIGSTSYRAWKNRKGSDPLRKLSSGMYQPTSSASEFLPLPTNATRKTP
jgi:cytoskeletal protein RodZ